MLIGDYDLSGILEQHLIKLLFIKLVGSFGATRDSLAIHPRPNITALKLGDWHLPVRRVD